jgi:hypothetical protein
MPDEQRSTTANTTNAKGTLTVFATQYTAASPTAVPMVEPINLRTAGREGEMNTVYTIRAPTIAYSVFKEIRIFITKASYFSAPSRQ